MNILVTGATGYAGFYAAIALREAGHTVRGLTRSPGKPRAQALLQHEVTPIEGDIGDPQSYRALLETSDAIVHAMMDFDSPQETDLALFDTLQQVAEAAPRRRHIVYTTGCSIYGKRPEYIMDETTPANPDHALAFRMAMEEKLFNTPIQNCVKTVLRPGFMYGLDGQSSITGMWFGMGEQGQAVYRGDRDKGWSWVHVQDLAEAYVNTLDGGKRLDGEVFCIANEQRPTCLDIMQACLDATGYSGDISFAEPQEDDVTSTWFNQNEFITSHKARRQLGWVPQHPGVIDDVETYYAAWKAAQSD